MYMTDNVTVCFKKTLILEPLFCNWYAWSLLIPPVTTSGFLKNHFLKILQSFVAEPEFHTTAASNPTLLGGPFANLSIDAVDKVKELIKKHETECADLLRLNSSIVNFDRFLTESARGKSLEDLYLKLPAELQGCVELIYDINRQPAIHFFEKIIYSKYYNASLQSISLKNLENDHRQFILSTPRFETSEDLHLPFDFKSEQVDKIFYLQTNPIKLYDLVEYLEIPEIKIGKLQHLVEPYCPMESVNNNYTGKGIRVRYINHACVLLQTNEINILIDPIVSHYQVSNIERFTLHDMPNVIDYVVITHNHQDHIVIETLLALRNKIKKIIVPQNSPGCIIDPSLKIILNTIGFDNVISLDKFETINFSHGSITSIPSLGEHGDLNIYSKCAYIIELFSKKFLFAADSNNLDQCLYTNVFSMLGSIDTLFIGMECQGAPISWVYGPLFTQPLPREYDQSRRLSGSNFERGWPLVEKSGAKQVFVYAMGQEPWLTHIMALKYTEQSPQIIESSKLIKKCLEKGIESEYLFCKKEWLYEA